MNLRQKCKALKRRVKNLEYELSPITVSPRFHSLQEVKIVEYKAAVPFCPHAIPNGNDDIECFLSKIEAKEKLLIDIASNITYTVTDDAVMASIFVGKRG